MRLLLRREWCLAVETLRRVRLRQRRIHPHALVEDKAFSVVVVATDCFEILQDPTIQAGKCP